ncbi:MOSC domain-containing protein [Jiulongibacter sp. NS-SX5]|uniref:MOSC domain-containing protein n=1 Tax=Jiulongibacter sp. NS-SX5 TaxID=3463854 RepID=UPI004058CB38
MELKQLMKNFPKSGKVEWIGVRNRQFDDLTVLDSVIASSEEGLQNDHYSGKNKKRQVTLIQKEHLNIVGEMLGKEVTPEMLRRNLVISGLNLLALKDTTFRIGDAILKYTGLCHPCSRMEKILGEGGYNAMRGHGGITAQILDGGIIAIGNELKVITLNK